MTPVMNPAADPIVPEPLTGSRRQQISPVGKALPGPEHEPRGRTSAAGTTDGSR